MYGIANDTRLLTNIPNQFKLLLDPVFNPNKAIKNLNKYPPSLNG